jgi:hypothetical protein
MSASTEIRMIMMPSTATSAVNPGDRSDLLLRHLSERLAVPPHGGAEDDAVLHRAAQHDADTIQSAPGRKPNCAASVGPTSGPGPAMAAKWWPKTIHLLVGTKSRPSASRSAGVARVASSAKIFAAMIFE